MTEVDNSKRESWIGQRRDYTEAMLPCSANYMRQTRQLRKRTPWIIDKLGQGKLRLPKDVFVTVAVVVVGTVAVVVWVTNWEEVISTVTAA